VRQVELAAFDTPAEADLVDALRGDPSWLDGLSYLAEAPSGVVVAHALLTRCLVGDTPAAALAPCAVLPGRQGRGAGTAVIRALLDAARAAGEHTVIVLGHPRYYPRFGFAPASRFGILPPQDWPDEAFLALGLNDATAPPQGTVRYPAPFGID